MKCERLALVLSRFQDVFYLKISIHQRWQLFL